MNFDKLNFDLSEFDINDIDFENMGSWPKAAKIAMALVVAIAVSVLSYMFLVSGKISELEQAEANEQQLRKTYRIKYGAAVNLDSYKSQMTDMEQNFSLLLKRLPSSHETPGLLDDITYVGTTSGLTFIRINWLPEIENEFYTELPIQIEVIGDYHEFGQFVSKVAALPRIVTLHEFSIEDARDKELRLNVVAKTYRYKESK
ncbi:type 4a pilus biogenesis protein PilO [Psychrosphaera sp. B3R10]|uniref:type 4a pilus biogenesis protein PilO n=1 Tax=unclassified Psychrosphaera TaxID=2641570 RepID=UPI001C096C4F|nr:MULTISPECIES: type 4a pilus biogenesis protein PilO [unclassified Psychrosphaera]MBU2881093.1 type 4a pilus biogenesis protein PilO [Psychrosphaera sp. I2R16]MBU2990017.1 type 4a pilus biogenesis protein PilO [Psychrosphaera sp. B3R10]MDO6721200.1 type 4a pilus biogenesis protein PilO [Psychrosphaera sp. 1_MG-2023]